jgi:hypothetical protein
MKYYQAVYQTDSHGFNVVYSKNIWKTEADAYEYLEALKNLVGKGHIYTDWVVELFVNEPA